MSSIADMKLMQDMILDKTIMIYGETKCGKSRIIIDILHTIQGKIDQILVFSPMDQQNKTYSAGYVPITCIHYDISKDMLDTIWERQNALMAAWKRAMNVDTLRSLFMRVSTSKGIDAVTTINSEFARAVAELRRSGTPDVIAKIEDMEKARDDALTKIYKYYIDRSRDQLSHMTLNEDETYSLKFIDFNPRIVIIFDDCTDIIQTLRNYPVMKKIFNQGRHAGITMIIAGHTDKCLLPEQRKSAFLSIFASEQAASQFFERKDLSDSLRRRGLDATRTAFTPMKKFQKLVWERESDVFYTFTATLHDVFRFGSKKLWEFNDRIKSDGEFGQVGNRFSVDFI